MIQGIQDLPHGHACGVPSAAASSAFSPVLVLLSAKRALMSLGCAAGLVLLKSRIDGLPDWAVVEPITDEYMILVEQLLIFQDWWTGEPFLGIQKQTEEARKP